MPRQVTKSPPIQFRLPLATYQWILDKALARDESVASFIVRNLNTNAQADASQATRATRRKTEKA